METSIGLTLTFDHGLWLAAVVLLYIQQALLFAIPVGLARKKYGIKPPTLYPNDSLIKELKLSKEDVENYNNVQRVHQNNVEFMCIFLPLFILAGFVVPQTFNLAIAGFVVAAGRQTFAFGYYSSASKRVLGGWYHFGEYYCVYLVGKAAYTLLTSAK